MENKNKTTGIIVGVIAVLLIGGGVIWAMNRNDDNNQSSQSQQTDQMTQSSKTIVVVASDTPSLSTLVTAVKAANLVDTLQESGPYTVFAPTNEAFEALPKGTLASLLKPENQVKLKSILTYHVVAGKVMSSDLKDGQEITTVEGSKLTVSIEDGKVYLTDATGNKVMVQQADIDAKNGVVHTIDGVLLPS
jgi:uncharacterized surface protein with fasciclin (FAS1) repeats